MLTLMATGKARCPDVVGLPFPFILHSVIFTLCACISVWTLYRKLDVIFKSLLATFKASNIFVPCGAVLIN